MDDRFKFRAWDKKRKGFINGFNMIGFSTGRGAPYKNLQRFSDYWDMDDVELKQCTGLKDKNDQLIFEGDIVKNKIAIGVVKFGNPDLFKDSMCSMFYWEMIKQLDSCEFCFEDDIFTEFKDCEIIGNIYENPELIEV